MPESTPNNSKNEKNPIRKLGLERMEQIRAMQEKQSKASRLEQNRLRQVTSEDDEIEDAAGGGMMKGKPTGKIANIAGGDITKGKPTGKIAGIAEDTGPDIDQAEDVNKKAKTAERALGTAGTATKAAGRTTQAAGAATQAAGKGVEGAGKGVSKVGKSVRRAGKKTTDAGRKMKLQRDRIKNLKSSKLGTGRLGRAKAGVSGAGGIKRGISKAGGAGRGKTPRLRKKIGGKAGGKASMAKGISKLNLDRIRAGLAALLWMIVLLVIIILIAPTGLALVPCSFLVYHKLSSDWKISDAVGELVKPGSPVHLIKHPIVQLAIRIAPYIDLILKMVWLIIIQIIFFCGVIPLVAMATIFGVGGCLIDAQCAANFLFGIKL